MHEYKGSFDEIAKKINDVGILTLQFQFDIFKSDGSVRELPLEERARQSEDALQWLLARSDVDKKRIGVLAQSFGVPTVMNANINNIESMVFVSGAYNPLESITRVYTTRGAEINYNGDTTLPRSSGEHTTVGKEFWKSLRAYNELMLAHKLSIPSLFLLHGDKDVYIKPKYLRTFYSALSIRKKKMKIFKNGDHGLTDVPRPMREEFLREVVEWFKQTV